MIDPEQENAGSWIALDVPAGEIDKIGLVIGWDKDESTFSDYARAKTIRVEVIDSGNGDAVKVDETFPLEDKRGWQIIDLVDSKVGSDLKGGRVRITINEVYPGHDFPNLAVSEFRVYMKEFEASTITLKTPPGSEEAGHPADNLVDGKDATFWAAASDTEPSFLILRAPGYGLATVGIRPGSAPYARPKTIAVAANDTSITYTMDDKAVMQWFLLPAIIGYTGSAFGDIRVEVVDTYPGGAGKGVAIGELKLNAATIDEL